MTYYILCSGRNVLLETNIGMEFRRIGIKPSVSRKIKWRQNNIHGIHGNNQIEEWNEEITKQSQDWKKKNQKIEYSPDGLENVMMKAALRIKMPKQLQLGNLLSWKTC